MRHLNRNRSIFILMIIIIKSPTCFNIEITRGTRDKILLGSETCQKFHANLPNGTCICLPASPTFMSTETDENFKCQQNEQINTGKHIIEYNYFDCHRGLSVIFTFTKV